MGTRATGCSLCAMLLVASGCDQLFGLPDVHVIPDAFVSPDAFVCSSPLIFDNFTGTTPCAQWGAFSQMNGATANEGDGTLTFTLPSGSNGKCISSPIAVPFGGFELELGQLPSGTTSSVSLLSTALDVSLYVFGNNLNLSPANGTNPTKVPYMPDQMRFLRLVPQTNNTIIGMYSPDGNNWTSLPTPLALATVPPMVDVIIKANGNGAGATTATFQLFVACP